MNLLPQPHHSLAHLYSNHDAFSLECRTVVVPDLRRPIPRFMPGQCYDFTCDRMNFRWRETHLSVRHIPEVIAFEGTEICFTTHDNDGVEWTFRERRMGDSSSFSVPARPSKKETGGNRGRRTGSEDEGRADPELSLGDLLSHFSVPPPPDIVTASPAAYAEAVRRVAELSGGDPTSNTAHPCSPTVQFRSFQSEDLARLSLVDGAILGWEQGLGKSIAAFAWPLLKWRQWSATPSGSGQNFRVLLIAPAGLHEQLIGDAMRLFRIVIHRQWQMVGGSSKGTTFHLASFEQAIRAGGAWRHAWDCIVVDEGVRLKSSDSLTAEAIRNLDPPFRLVLTGTPLKNKLADLFPLCWWACQRDEDWVARTGYGFRRWPFHERYQDGPMFRQKFLVPKRNLTRERATGRSCTGWTNTVQNIHELWTLLGPILLRRAKAGIVHDQLSAMPKVSRHGPRPTDHELVSKHRHLIRVPMSAAQWQVTAAILANDQDASAKLNALRLAAIHCAGQPTPKMTAALSLTRRFVAEGRAVLLFSPFLDPLDLLSDLLTAAGLPHLVCDGRLSPRKRAEFAKRFQGSSTETPNAEPRRPHIEVHKVDAPTQQPAHLPGRFPILLACSESMAEGYNFPRCSRIIHLGLPWALDTLLQSEARGWRLNSVEDLHVFRLVSEGSIDGLMETQMQHKAATAELVIDGIIRRAPAVSPTPSDLLWIYHQSTPITL